MGCVGSEDAGGAFEKSIRTLEFNLSTFANYNINENNSFCHNFTKSLSYLVNYCSLNLFYDEDHFYFYQ